jgi:hypothetical protein
VDAGNGMIALQASANGNYISAWQDTPEAPLQARAIAISNWETFQWVTAGTGKVALVSKVSGEYVSAWQASPSTPFQARAAFDRPGSTCLAARSAGSASVHVAPPSLGFQRTLIGHVIGVAVHHLAGLPAVEAHQVAF